MITLETTRLEPTADPFALAHRHSRLALALHLTASHGLAKCEEFSSSLFPGMAFVRVTLSPERPKEWARLRDFLVEAKSEDLLGWLRVAPGNERERHWLKEFGLPEYLLINPA